jgi:hypothetical protein
LSACLSFWRYADYQTSRPLCQLTETPFTDGNPRNLNCASFREVPQGWGWPATFEKAHKYGMSHYYHNVPRFWTERLSVHDTFCTLSLDGSNRVRDGDPLSE